MSTACVHVFSCLHNLQEGGMIVLYELFQKHEAFACKIFTDEKTSQGIFGHFMPLVAYNIFCHAIFGNGIKWPKVASGIYLPTLLGMLKNNR